MAVTISFTNAARQVEVIALDATPSQTHGTEVDVTEHPVETGANIADNVRPKPAPLTLDALLTDFPLGGGAGAEGRSLDTYAQLERLQAAGTLCTVATSLKTYSNMVLRSLRAPRDKGTKRAVRVSLTFHSIRFADSQTVALQPGRTRLTKAKAEADLGKQTATDASTGERGKSWLAQFADSFGSPPDALKKAPVK